MGPSSPSGLDAAEEAIARLDITQSADGGQLWPSRDFCVRVGWQGSGGDGERTDGASDVFARFRELMRARGRAG